MRHYDWCVMLIGVVFMTCHVASSIMQHTLELPPRRWWTMRVTRKPMFGVVNTLGGTLYVCVCVCVQLKRTRILTFKITYKAFCISPPLSKLQMTRFCDMQWLIKWDNSQSDPMIIIVVWHLHAIAAHEGDCTDWIGQMPNACRTACSHPSHATHVCQSRVRLRYMDLCDHSNWLVVCIWVLLRIVK